MPLISGTDQLAEFRRFWTGSRILDLVKHNNGRLLIDWAIGLGKSFNIDQTIEAAISTSRYDLVVALFPTRRVINERKWIVRPCGNVKIVNLKPRPQKQCGKDLNHSWEIFEKNGLGALGRIELCGHCFLNKSCHWPKQYGKSLKDVQVVFGTQAHLERSPNFINQIIQWSEAKQILVILDETNFIMKPFHRHITKKHLNFFLDVLNLSLIHI